MEWVDLTGGEHITNYIHMIGAQHVYYYLKRYRNLYMYSQQGWEAVNQKIKAWYFNNTNRGSNCGKQCYNEHLLPIFKMCVCQIMWHTGLGDSFFNKKGVMYHRSDFTLDTIPEAVNEEGEFDDDNSVEEETYTL